MILLRFFIENIEITLVFLFTKEERTNYKL